VIMGFTKADFPPVDPEAFLQQPLMERMKVLALHWRVPFTAGDRRTWLDVVVFCLMAARGTRNFQHSSHFSVRALRTADRAGRERPPNPWSRATPSAKPAAVLEALRA
jgi:hypothetical protein